MTASASPGPPSWSEQRLSARVRLLGFAGGVVALAAILFGIVKFVGWHCHLFGVLLAESDPMTTTNATRPWWDRITPRAGFRVQMFSAALLWFVGMSFLLVRGVLFVVVPCPSSHFSFWLVPIAQRADLLRLHKARFCFHGGADKVLQ